MTVKKGSELFELRFDFEQSEKCFFYSDPSAPLQWKMIESSRHDELNDRTGIYSLDLWLNE